MKIQDLTSRQLKVFHNRMARELGVRFYSSGLLAWAMRKLYDRFIARYLPLPDELFELRPFTVKNRIFLTCPPGSDKLTPLEQVQTAVHECTHALRIRDYPGTVANWYGNYFTDDDFRALEETSAKEAKGEFRYWLYGNYPRLNLEGYLCRAEAEALASVAYEKHMNLVKRGGRGTTVHRASQVAKAILISLGVERNK